METNGTKQQYKVSYEYVSPSRAGPFKGRTILDYKPAKGDCISAMMGQAIVRTVSKVREA